MYFKLAWRNIWRNKRRTIITLSSIGFAVFFACLMQSMQLGSYERMIDNTVRFSTGHLQIHAKGFWDKKTIDKSIAWNDDLKEKVIENQKIEAITPRLESFALAAFKEKTKGVMVVGIDPANEQQITNLDNKVVRGHYFTTDEGALIGKDLAKFLDAGIGDTLVLISQGYHGVNAAGKYPIEGILRFPNPQYNQQAVFLKLPAAQYFYGANGMITSLSVLLKDADDLQNVKRNLKSRLNGDIYEVMTWKEMMPELLQSIELDYYGGLIMIFILYAVIAFGIFGTFLMMMKERTYEFGVLVSIGMRKLKIQIMIGLEILAMAFLGVIAGILLSLPLLIYFHNNPIPLTGGAAESMEKFGWEAILPFSLDPQIFTMQGLVILGIAIFLGFYPMIAIKLLKTNRALRE